MHQNLLPGFQYPLCISWFSASSGYIVLNSLDHELANCNPWAKYIYIYFLNTATPIHLHTVYGYFHITVTKLNSWDRDYLACKPKGWSPGPLSAKFTDIFTYAVPYPRMKSVPPTPHAKIRFRYSLQSHHFHKVSQWFQIDYPSTLLPTLLIIYYVYESEFPREAEPIGYIRRDLFVENILVVTRGKMGGGMGETGEGIEYIYNDKHWITCS